MPTGYTIDVYNGNLSQKDFMVACAQAMGAFFDQRDLDYPFDPVKSLKSDVDSFYYDTLKEYEAEFEKFSKFMELGVKGPKVITEYEGYVKATIDSENEYNVKALKIAENYREMIRKIEGWSPPSENHIAYKEFMLKQLRDGLEFDGSPINVEVMSIDEWLRERYDSSIRMLENSKNRLEDAKAKLIQHNEWITNLINSLPSD